MEELVWRKKSYGNMGWCVYVSYYRILIFVWGRKPWTEFDQVKLLSMVCCMYDSWETRVGVG